jgi:cytoskeletal protein CcmA (bactofilin family)
MEEYTMSFFKEFKEDLSQAVNELLPEEDLLESDTELKNDEELLEDSDESIDLDNFDNLLKSVSNTDDEDITPLEEEAVEEAPVEKAKAKDVTVQEEVVPVAAEIPSAKEPTAEPAIAVASDESAVITKGTTIKGDIDSTGSLEIVGTVTGNVSCSGKLTITGKVTGNSKASEIFADAAKVEGEVVSEGTVKVGVGSVIIGNVTATSAVIAGAINGDIDVKGPVIVDSSAVIMGDIKSRSVQINNGAVIEGFCSQCYSEVNVKAFFEEKK